MKLDELRRGIDALLKNHPETATWDIFNEYEKAFADDFSVRPDKTTKIPEMARIDQWGHQRWFWDEIRKEEPPEWLVKQWEREKLQADIVKFLRDEYTLDKFVGPNETVDVSPGNPLFDYTNLFLGGSNEPNVAVRFMFKSTYTERYGQELTSMLWTTCFDAARQVMGYQATASVEQLLQCLVKNRLESCLEKLDMRDLCPYPDWLKDIRLITVPFELGSGTIFVFTFAA